jgi:hypothetical protein
MWVNGSGGYRISQSIMRCIGVQECTEAPEELADVLCFAFPNGKHFPAELTQRSSISFVSFAITRELFSPEKRIGFWLIGVSASPMLMPKASVHEDHLSKPGKDDIGSPRQVASMQAKSISKRVSHASNENFWLSVLSLYAGHQSGAFCRRDDVHSCFSVCLKLNDSWP